MKEERTGKRFEYGYTLIHLKKDLHTQIKTLAQKEKICMTKLIAKAIKDYENRG